MLTLEITIEPSLAEGEAAYVPALMDEAREHVQLALAYYPYLPQGFSRDWRPRSRADLSRSKLQATELPV